MINQHEAVYYGDLSAIIRRKSVFNWFLKTIFWMTALFLISITVIRARPYEASAFNQALAPVEDCRLPCFMTIRPGMTTADEAYDRLTAHNWVADIVDDTRPASDGGIPGISGDLFWTWSGTQPDWVDATVMGQVRLQRGMTRFISLKTTAQLGDLHLTLPTPDWEIVFFDRMPNDALAIHHRSAYRQTGLLFQTDRQNCPAQVLWKQPVTVTIWGSLVSSQSSGTTGNVNAGCMGH